jgi:hypothetical protein
MKLEPRCPWLVGVEKNFHATNQRTLPRLLHRNSCHFRVSLNKVIIYYDAGFLLNKLAGEMAELVMVRSAVIVPQMSTNCTSGARL